MPCRIVGNLFLAAGTAVGIGVAAGTDVGQDWVLVIHGCLFMLGAGLVLLLSNRRLRVTAAIQATPPASPSR